MSQSLLVGWPLGRVPVPGMHPLYRVFFCPSSGFIIKITFFDDFYKSLKYKGFWNEKRRPEGRLLVCCTAIWVLSGNIGHADRIRAHGPIGELDDCRHANKQHDELQKFAGQCD
jgi:hypothetical protein